MMHNYFLIYRPFHFEYAKRIINAHLATEQNVMVNHYVSAAISDNIQNVQKVINLSKGVFRRAIEIKRIKSELRKLAKQGEPITVFIPHSLGLLSNYAYFTLASRYNNVKVNVFYEGIIVFYTYDHHYFRNFRYYFTRWLVSLFSGIPYKIDKRLLNFNDKRIHKIYTPFLNIEAPREKIIRTSLQKVEFVPEEGVAIVLGLSLDSSYKDDLERIIRRIYTELESAGVTTIFYKDHPAEKCEMFYTIAKDMGKHLVLIDDKSPIENIIGNYKPKFIVSIWSSGIINLSDILPSSTRIICFVTEKITASQETKKIIQAFKSQGIDVIYA